MLLSDPAQAKMGMHKDKRRGIVRLEDFRDENGDMEELRMCRAKSTGLLVTNIGAAYALEGKSERFDKYYCEPTPARYCADCNVVLHPYKSWGCARCPTCYGPARYSREWTTDWINSNNIHTNGCDLEQRTALATMKIPKSAKTKRVKQLKNGPAVVTAVPKETSGWSHKQAEDAVPDLKETSDSDLLGLKERDQEPWSDDEIFKAEHSTSLPGAAETESLRVSSVHTLSLIHI